MEVLVFRKHGRGQKLASAVWTVTVASVDHGSWIMEHGQHGELAMETK